MKRISLIKMTLSLAALMLLTFTCHAATIGPWNITSLKQAPSYRIDNTAEFKVAGMDSILYESVNYKGNKVEVFAYYSAPSGNMPTGGWPAVVYVHGGAGSALPTWVEYWNDRGYAAITMDHHGHYPDRTTQTPNPGPDKIGTWGDYQLPVDEQWYYHAVAQVVRATSLIGSFPEVNANKIGMMGTSWGGNLTSTVMGIDNRLRWAVPVYGGGYLSDSDGSQGTAMTAAKAAVVNANYDGRLYFDNVDFPTLWINGTNDSNFSMTVTKDSSNAVSYPAQLRYSLRLRHNNTFVTSLDEIGAFADMVISGDDPMPEFQAPGVTVNNVAYAKYTSNPGLSSAQVLYTTDDGTWYDRVWYAADATITNTLVKANVPAGATTLYFTATDNRGLMTSSEYIELTDSGSGSTPTTPSGNLALNGTATQSSTDYNGVASRAIDGNTNGAWRSGSVTHTTAEDAAWWGLELDAEYAIDEIVIYNRTDSCCTDRLSSYVVLMWDADGNRTLRKIESTAPSPSRTISLSGQAAKKIMIRSRLAGTALSIAEVEVYGN